MMSVLPFLLIAAGIAMRVFAGRAAFNRRNEYGTEIFSSYGHMKARRGFEGLIRILGFILILAGIGQALSQGVVHRSSSSQSSATEKT